MYLQHAVVLLQTILKSVPPYLSHDYEKLLEGGLHNVRSHTVAVAEKHGKLDEIVTHYASNHLGSNVTLMILLGTPSSSGQKPNQKSQTRRKRPQKQSSVKKVSRFQLPCSSTSDTSKTISTPSYSHASFSFDRHPNYSGTLRSTSLSFAYEGNCLNLGMLPPTNPSNDW